MGASRSITSFSRWCAAGFLFCTPLSQAEVVINEIHYHPGKPTESTEFVELHNSGDRSVDVGGWYLSDGVVYRFPVGTAMEPGGYLVVASDPPSLLSVYGARSLGPLQGRLSNQGDRVVLRDPSGNVVDEVTYGVGFPWPTASDGEGGSIELIHPSLDNDLGGSWRASQVPEAQRLLPSQPLTLVKSRALFWHYRKGDAEPSSDPGAWRLGSFFEDESWLVGTASIGYGDGDDLTELPDMKGGYSSLYLRRGFWATNVSSIPKLLLRVFTGDGAIVWINGVEVARLHVAAGELGHADVSGEESRTPRWEEVDLSSRVSGLLWEGVNVASVHALNSAIGDDGLSIDLELLVPGAERAPTPGARNSVYAERAPPQIRQVEHSPVQPSSASQVVVSAKVTDPDGVRLVRLLYQVVRPGEFLPAFLPLAHNVLLDAPETPLAPNPAYEAAENWQILEMNDDGAGGDAQPGDGVYSATLPPFSNRTLVRYRVRAQDQGDPAAEVRVPYPDDASLNFAFFVYNGVPSYKPDTATVHPEGLGHQYSAAVMTSVPAYHVLARESDFLEAHGYDPALQLPQWRRWPNDYHPAYDKYNWECALVCDGEVYDHVPFRLRQANARYLWSGKRSLRFRFNPGHRFQARDERGQPYPLRWRTLNLGRMIDVLGNSNFGLVETINRQLWDLMRVPVPRTHYVHLRVVDAPEEAPQEAGGQYLGDFWGLYLAMEDYNPEFLEARNMPDGNLYKLQAFVYDGNELKRHQGKASVRDDSDFQNVWRNVAPERNEAWLRAHIDFDLWYRVIAVADAVRHVDFGTTDSMLKNQAWFFEPSGTNPLGRLAILPWDTDVSWGPAFIDAGYDFPRYALFHTNGLGSPVLAREFRAAFREFRDLVWREDVVNPMIDRLAAGILEISRADRDRWRGAPYGGDSGSIEEKVSDMKAFAFVGWNGKDGPPVPSGGRAAYLDRLANVSWEQACLPSTPEIRYAGGEGFPLDDLWFTLSAFSDPQGTNTFGASKWRVGEVADPDASPIGAWTSPLCEAQSVWESEEQTEWKGTFRVPGWSLLPGHAYRVRVKVRDQDGFWSHWSDPVQFIAGAPLASPNVAGSLRITEIMYHAPADEVFDFIEIVNIGRGSVPLATVELRGEVQYVFRNSAKAALVPGERVVLVSDANCFRQKYSDPAIQVLGEYDGNLSNKRGSLSLVDVGSGQSWQMAYEDDWYPETDGDGYSLVLRDPLSSSSDTSSKRDWMPSATIGGSPGVTGEKTDHDGDELPDDWEVAYGFDPSSPDDLGEDSDGDGLSTWQEYQAGTDPADAVSTIRLEAALRGGWLELLYGTVVPNPLLGCCGTRYYQLERRRSVSDAWEPVGMPNEGTGEAMTLLHPVAADGVPVFYRLRVWQQTN